MTSVHAQAAELAATTEMVGMGQVLLAFAPCKLTAVLGSCVGIAFFEPHSRVAVLAHVVLPDSEGRDVATPGKYADTAVPHMLDLLRRQGLPTSGLVVRVAGGACMFGRNLAAQHVGEINAAAVLQTLAAFQLNPIAQHTGGAKGRRVTLNTRTGEFLVEIVGSPPVTL